jgi:hypothetical protein
MAAFGVTTEDAKRRKYFSAALPGSGLLAARSSAGPVPLQALKNVGYMLFAVRICIAALLIVIDRI